MNTSHLPMRKLCRNVARRARRSARLPLPLRRASSPSFDGRVRHCDVRRGARRSHEGPLGRTRTCVSRSARERFDGVGELWVLEGQNPGDLDRAHIPRDIIKVGDTVTFAGNPSTRRERRMYVTNVLLPDRTEIVLRANAQPRWSPDRYLSHLQATVDPAARGGGSWRRHLSRLAADRFQDAGLGERSAAHATPRAPRG